MEPFVIRCATCKAKLKVRDVSAVGQILACPKCRSMVLIEPPMEGPLGLPAGTSPRPSTSSPAPRVRRGHDSSEETVSGAYDDLEQLVSPTAAPPASPNVVPNAAATAAHPASPTPTSDADGKLGRARSARSDGDTVSDSQFDAIDDPSAPPSSIRRANASLGSVPTHEPPGPSAAFDAPEIRRFRQKLLVAATAVSATVVVLLVSFYAAGRLWPPTGVETNKLAAKSGDHQALDPILPAPVNSDGDSTNSNSANVPPRHGDTSDTIAPETGSASPQAGDKTDEVSDPTDRSPDAAIPGDATSVTPAGDSDPADSENLVKPANSANDGTAIDVNADPDELKAFPARSPFAPLLELIADGAERADDAPIPPARPNDAPQEVNTEKLPDLVRPAPRIVDVQKQIGFKLNGIRYPNPVPLKDFLDEMSLISGVPFTIDLHALQVLQISPTQGCKVEAESTTIQALLSGIFKSHRLGMGIVDSHAIVTFGSEMVSDAKLVRIPIGDLTDDDAEQAALIGHWVEAFVAPQSWQASGGAGTLVAENKQLQVTSLPAHQAEVILFCDRLRFARGLPLSLYTAEELQLWQSPWSENSKLAVPIALNFVRPTRFTQILQRIERESQLTIFVDWQALEEAGWNQGAILKFSSEGKSLTDALTTLLEPMELTFRVANRSAIQVTTAKALWNRIFLEFYPLAELVDGGQPLEQILQNVAAAVDPRLLRANGGPCDLEVDRKSQHLLANFPYSQHLRISEALTQMGRMP